MMIKEMSFIDSFIGLVIISHFVASCKPTIYIDQFKNFVQREKKCKQLDVYLSLNILVVYVLGNMYMEEKRLW